MSDTTKQIAIRPRAVELLIELWDKHELEIDVRELKRTKSGLMLIELAYDSDDELLTEWLEYKIETLVDNEEGITEV